MPRSPGVLFEANEDGCNSGGTQQISHDNILRTEQQPKPGRREDDWRGHVPDMEKGVCKDSERKAKHFLTFLFFLLISLYISYLSLSLSLYRSSFSFIPSLNPSTYHTLPAILVSLSPQQHKPCWIFGAEMSQGKEVGKQ